MSVFGNDPWWIVLIKVVFVVVFLLAITIFNVWYERRLVGKMQQRKGPIMNGPFGLGQALGDGLKLMFKEDFRPAGTDKWVFTIAPLLTGIAEFTELRQSEQVTTATGARNHDNREPRRE